jgi:ATP-dependent DNA helicase RecG
MRPTLLNSCFITVDALKGVGPAVLSQLQKLLHSEEGRLPTLRDLAFHMPMDVIDRGQHVDLTNLQESQIVTLTLRVEEHAAPRRRNMPYRIACSHSSGEQVMLVFFQGRAEYLSQQLPNGEERIISGRLERTSYGLQMIHPEFILRPEEKSQLPMLEPVYPLTAGLHAKKLRHLIKQAMARLQPLPEWLDASIVQQYGWLPWLESVRTIHSPTSVEDVRPEAPPMRRLAYDELLAHQCVMAIARQRMKRPQSAQPLAPAAKRQALLEALPFQLTAGQQQVVAEIDRDMASSQPMLRLLQGDVGSGKTAVALAAIVNALEHGAQAALMVPTEILGRQHMAFLEPLLSGLGFRAALLTGNTDAGERSRILYNLARGEIGLIIGTHALFQEKVEYHALGLVVMDEQHRFGVNQRLKLSEKGHNPHLLLMTATPIPRSLAMTLYGDMDVSKLTEKPAGRQPITTRVMPIAREEEILQAIGRALQRNEKIYWICPLVEGGEDASSDLSAATERYREFSARFGNIVGLAHGRMDAAERQQVMEAFAGSQLRLLVATTVVEVGVNVPDATIMVIEHAERFGLAQLHQLRGRVGRGDKPSSCLLLYKGRLSEYAEQRMRALRDSEDGFYLAEEDLRLRGSGDILGVKQSGLPDFYFADLARDRELSEMARNDSRYFLERDPDLTSERGKALRVLLYLFEKDRSLRYLKSG